jgi:hypothetical protein
MDFSEDAEDVRKLTTGIGIVGGSLATSSFGIGDGGTWCLADRNEELEFG